jgi:hypothetical protein
MYSGVQIYGHTHRVYTPLFLLLYEFMTEQFVY